MKTLAMTMSIEQTKTWFVLFIMTFLTAVILLSCTNEERVVQPIIHPVYYEQIFTNEQQSSIYVPSHAVCEDLKGRYVYLIEITEPGFGIAHRQTVELGELCSSGLQILHGVSDGDLVISKGSYYIQDGAAVRLIQQTGMSDKKQ